MLINLLILQKEYALSVIPLVQPVQMGLIQDVLHVHLVNIDQEINVLIVILITIIKMFQQRFVNLVIVHVEHVQINQILLVHLVSLDSVGEVTNVLIVLQLQMLMLMQIHVKIVTLHVKHALPEMNSVLHAYLLTQDLEENVLIAL